MDGGSITTLSCAARVVCSTWIYIHTTHYIKARNTDCFFLHARCQSHHLEVVTSTSLAARTRQHRDAVIIATPTTGNEILKYTAIRFSCSAAAVLASVCAQHNPLI